MVTLLGARLVLPGGVVHAPLQISGGRVVESSARGHEVDLRGHFVVPAFINAHDHLAINCVPPLESQARFDNSYAWAKSFGRHFRVPAVARSLAISEEVRFWHGGLKNLLCGAMTVLHHDPWHEVLESPDFPVRVPHGLGWCHSLGMAPAESDPQVTGNPWNKPPTGKSLVARARRSIGRLLRPQPSRFGPAVRASFLQTPSDRSWIIHLAEGTDAIARAEFTRLVDLGCLKSNTVLVHAVGLDDSDVELLIKRGAAVVWCPSSNLKLLGTTLNPRRLFAAGRLALGTDSRVSGARDFLHELRVAAAQGILSREEIFDVATRGASQILGLSEVGGLATGQAADLLVIRDDGRDLHEQIFSLERADIRAVVRRGSIAISDSDPEFRSWFRLSGREPKAATLDGRGKIIDGLCIRADSAALEPGLSVGTESV